MSYSRSYSERIIVSGHKSETFSYPASQSGGSRTVTVYYEEVVPVDVNIHVDTIPYDRSVGVCNQNVQTLTGTVIAFQTAEVAAKVANSKKVASTVIDGFFGYIRSEISQQISELTQAVDAHLMHMRELAQSCLAKKKQLEGDYHRISGRYSKIFEDLNRELSNRVSELDKTTFGFVNESNSNNSRYINSDLATTVALFGKDNSETLSRLSTSIAKKRALDTLNQAKLFLWQQKFLGRTIAHSMLNESTSGSKYTPVCFCETNNENNQINRDVYTPAHIPSLGHEKLRKEITEKFVSSVDFWNYPVKEYKDNLESYLSTELRNWSSGGDEHSTRVRGMIRKLISIDKIKVTNN